MVRDVACEFSVVKVSSGEEYSYVESGRPLCAFTFKAPKGGVYKLRVVLRVEGEPLRSADWSLDVTYAKGNKGGLRVFYYYCALSSLIAAVAVAAYAAREALKAGGVAP